MTDAEWFKQMSEANLRSYEIAYEALELSRKRNAELEKQLVEMRTYRDNASKRLEWAQTDVARWKKEAARLKRLLTAAKRAAKGKPTPKRSSGGR